MKNRRTVFQIISDKGRIVGTYDKQKLTPAEFDWYSPGNGFLALTINGMKCGFLICYELCFPALFETYRKKGVRLIYHSCHTVSRKAKPLFSGIDISSNPNAGGGQSDVDCKLDFIGSTFVFKDLHRTTRRHGSQFKKTRQRYFTARFSRY